MMQATLPRALTPEAWETILKLPGVRRRGQRVTFPDHAVQPLDLLLKRLGIDAQGVAWITPKSEPFTWDEVTARLHANGEVREGFLDGYALPHQKDGVTFACSHRGSLLHHPTGSGKTYSAIITVCAHPKDVAAVVLTRSSTVVQFARQFVKYTHLEAFPLRSKVHIRKRDRFQSLDEYLGWAHDKGQRPVVIAGYENVARFQPDLLRIAERFLFVVDESHLLSSHKRFSVTTLPHPGALPDPAAFSTAEAWEDAQAKHTLAMGQYAVMRKAGERRKGFVKVDEHSGEHSLIEPSQNRTRAAFDVGKRAHRVVLTTATPIRDRVRDLYGQLTLMQPDSWGSWTAWSNRYCDARPNQFNARARDTRGLSNAEELTHRIGGLIHSVSAPEVRKHLPGFRRETLYVEQAQMCPLTDAEKKRFAREVTKARQKGKNAIIEVRIAEAAARCRKAILDRIQDHVDSGHKIVVFVTRKWLAKALRGHVSGRVRKKALILCGTGDDSQNARRDMLDAYIEHEGAAILIGTGHAWGTSTDGMQCTNAAFFLGHPVEPGILDQWEGRFPRFGQSEPITIYYVVGEGTVLEHYAELVIDKLPAVAQIADSGALAGVEAALAGTLDVAAITDSIFGKLGIDIDEGT
jgi:hypothetical protein